MSDVCFPCKRNLHDTCREGDCGCYGRAHKATVGDDAGDNESSGYDDISDEQSQHNNRRSRRTKPDAALKDQESTGRKRAARLYPLLDNTNQPLKSSRTAGQDERADCEWRFGIRVGGGDNPIQGCVSGKQYARHHGPDKNTLNNEPGNVHRICHNCHNQWHAKNDPDYDPNKPLKD
jgi:hypothetical protein